MTTYANQAAFNDPASRRRAEGVDLNPARAIVDPSGRPLVFAQTGGILGPQRAELALGELIYRFGALGRGAQSLASGAWWVQGHEFGKLLRFAEVHELGLGVAVRLLALVPPEWSEMTLLVKARVRQPLLAWRGLANSVVAAKDDGGPPVRMPHQNEIAARRLNQLFVPGLDRPGLAQAALAIEGEYALDKAEGLRGFLYL